MMPKSWVTKEDLARQLIWKSPEEQKKIIRQAFQMNATKYKRGLKDKKMPTTAQDTADRVNKLEDEIEFFLEQQDWSALEKYEFLNTVKSGISNQKVKKEDLLKALYIGEMSSVSRPNYLDSFIEKHEFWLNTECVEFLGLLSALSETGQKNVFEFVEIVTEEPKIFLAKWENLIKGLDELTKNTIAKYVEIDRKVSLVFSLFPEILKDFCLEFKRKPEVISVLMAYTALQFKKEDRISIEATTKVAHMLLDEELQKLEAEASKERNVKKVYEKVQKIFEELKQEPKKYIAIPFEQLEKLPFKLLLEIVEVVMDNNTEVYINLFKKAKETTIPKTAMSKEELEALSYLKKYYKNGEIINVPEDIEEFTAALKRIHKTEDEIRYLLNQVNTLLEKESLIVEEVVISNEIKESQENELVYLKSGTGNYYALKDLDDIPKEYYASFLELLVSIKNNHFKNRKNLTDVSKVLEVKNFKTRIIFSRVGQTKYAILGMFMKKVDKDKVQREFLLARQNQFLRQVETLRTTENETEITELLLAKLNQNEDTLDMSLNRTKKEN